MKGKKSYSNFGYGYSFAVVFNEQLICVGCSCDSGC